MKNFFCLRPFVFTLLLLPALPFTGKAQTAPLPEAYKKFVNFFSSERMKVREGGCNDCSNIVLLKLQFGKRDIPDSVFLSYSAPLSIQSWTTKIRELDIDWKQLLKDNGKAKTVILPVLYINEISGGSAMFASARDLSQGLFQFANGGLPAGDTTKWWEPIIITTTTANTESSMLLNNKNLQQK